MIKQKHLKSILLATSLTVLLAACDDTKVTSDANGQETEGELSSELAKQVEGSEFYLTSENKTKVWPVFKVEEGKEIPQEGYLWTNIDTHFAPHPDVIAFPYPTPIYDISFVNYSAAFAERHGYPAANVISLPEGMELIGYSMTTEGIYTVCKLIFLLDSGQNTYGPKGGFRRIFDIAGSHFGVPIRLPQKVEGFEEHPEDFDHRMNVRKWSGSDGEDQYVLRNVFLVGGFDPEKDKFTFGLSLFLEAYYPDIYQGLDYASVVLGCSDLITTGLKSPTSQIWVKKDGGADYRKEQKLNPEDFNKYLLPIEFVEKFVPLLRDPKDMIMIRRRLPHDYYTPEDSLGQSYYYYFDEK